MKVILFAIIQIQIKGMKVEQKWFDSCGNDVQCSKLKPSCSVKIGEYGAPYCKRFGNDTILINLYKNQRIPYRVSRIKSIKILNGRT